MGDLRMTFDDNGLIRRYAGADRVFGEELTRAVTTASLEGHNESKRIIQANRRIDLTQLFRSIAVDRVARLGTVVRGGWGTNAPHALVNEKGRGAGKKMPPQGVLLPWMARHGIPASAEFPVRRKIGRKGIPGIWFMRDSREKVRPIFRREVDAAERRAIRRIVGGR